MRVCKKCNIEKEIDLFVKNKNCKLSREYTCKVCTNKIFKMLPSRNPEIRKEVNKKYRSSEKGILKKKKYYKENYATIKIKNKEYIDNRPWLKCWRNTLNNTLSRVFRKKINNTQTILGYSAQDLKIHLESLFTKDMNWLNYGKEWVVDHIKPVSKFNKDEDIKVVCALSNLQPLNKLENLIKYNKYEQE